MEYSKLSKDITKNISKNEKKLNGIYFTPPSTIHKSLEFLKPYLQNISTVLEPSCGSCEYIQAFHNFNNNLHITGIEFNNNIYNKIKHYSKENIQIINEDFLNYNFTSNFDLIIGNPPYYVMKKKDVSSYYYEYFQGRPNIFILFIIKSLQLLNDNGILSFVLPKSFTNCSYYNKTRIYIHKHFQILNIIDCSQDKYLETQQDTILFIVQKKNKIKNKKFTINIGCNKILTYKSDIVKLKILCMNSKSLNDLGFTVSVGTVVWNQVKDKLTDDDSKTRLIYSSDLLDGKIIKKTYKNEQKKNYIDKDGINDLMLVVNRGYGTGKYNFNYCLIDVDYDYLIENHLICIKYKKAATREKLKELYESIMKSMNNKKTKKFIDTYFGNSAINTTELNHILPIYN
jgi:tRNA1(Val) A37 N6-methylase TrmN6